MKKWLLFIAGLLLPSILSVGQLNPDQDEIYRPNEIAVISITIHPDDLAFLLAPENVASLEYKEATFHMKNSLLDTLLSNTVGIRLRGNTSRYHPKKPFKISFTVFDGEKFYDYKKFNLKPNNNDPSQLREPLTLKLFRSMNVPASRTHPVKLYINDEYMGVYTNVEQIDDEFIDRRFGHENGFLYKCGYGANLEDNGQVFNAEMFESEMNSDTDTRNELDQFVEVLNTTDDLNFSSAIEQVFNVDSYLRQLAVEVLTGHWDAYSYNMNNFYLFYNEDTGLIEFIPYDADNTWGIDWVGQDWAFRDIGNWVRSDQPRPLTNRILYVPAYRQKFIDYLNQLLEQFFNESFVNPITDDYKALLNEAILEDTYFATTFGFSHEDFLNSFVSGINGTHVKYGIREFLELRSQTAVEQINNLITAIDPERANSLVVYPTPSRQPFFTISNTPLPVAEKTLVYSLLGQPIPVSISNNYPDMNITLPSTASPGMYIIVIGKKSFRWVYMPE